MTIYAVGSINMDIINRVQRHPVVGETIKGLESRYSPGGKGANQAIAAARAGGNVRMIGAVGRDAFGDPLIEALKQSGVDASAVQRKEGSSGLAFITVADDGDNTIILSEGANGKLSEDDVEPFLAQAKPGDLLLLQNEIPPETNRYAIVKASQIGMRTIYNFAPAIAIDKALLQRIDLLILNESEAESLTGLPAGNEQEAEKSAARLLEDRVKAVIITLGEQGSLYMNHAGDRIFTPAFPVTPVDTTAAGDTFIGAFAAASALSYPLEKCLRFASAAAAVTVTREGAVASIPRFAEIEAFLADRSGQAK